jgi:putative transposase
MMDKSGTVIYVGKANIILMLKAYKYRLKPTNKQKTLMDKHIGCCRLVYNWALEQKIKTYEQTGKSINHIGLDALLPALKTEKAYLKDTNSQSLQGMTKHVDAAFVRFFREKNGFPKFKSKKNPIQSFPVPQHYTVDFENSNVKLPKIGKVEAVFHRIFEGTLRTATVSRSCTGKYYISILVEDGKEIPSKSNYDELNTIGVDVGIKDFAVLSNGEKLKILNI